jgi:hypothetical protein
MFFSEENRKIYALYESPDTIFVYGRYYQYDDPDLDNYTAIIDDKGNYVMSNDIVGHGALRRHILRRKNLKKYVKTNLKDYSDILTLARENNDIRIWPKIGVVSMWRLFGIEDYKAAITAAIVAAGGNPETYLYDEYDGGSNSIDEFKRYHEIFGQEVTEKDKKSRSEASAKRARDQKEFGNYMARSKDVDYGMGEAPTFYKQKKIPKF